MKALAYLILVLLAGCQTTAQKQMAHLRETQNLMAQNAQWCIQHIEANPTYQSLAVHISLNGNRPPSLQQLADNNYPDESEVKLLFSFHNDLIKCREQAIQALNASMPGAVPTLVAGYHAADLVTADLIQRKITYGESNKRIMALRDEYLVKLQTIGNQVDRELEQAHLQEIERQRQAMQSALMQWQYLNSINRPTTTNCITSNIGVNCTSY